MPDTSYLDYRLKHANARIDDINRRIDQLMKDRAVYEREIDEVMEQLDKLRS